MKIKDIMDPLPDIIRTSDTFEHLIKILDDVKYHVVFVVDKEEKLVGIVTEGDIIKVLVPKYVTVDESLISVMDVNYFERKCKERKDLSITEIMSKTTFSVREEDPIIKAAALMVVNKIHTIPVVRENKIVGIVSRLTLIKHITKVLTEH
ncbi:MAG TPA: CBS domain-containing protein [Candidatus Wunengus sp. YC63]|uniref:CBS domain-containing protein n=1 Tax=unclassified Candidatus Wunengus TaxID=3367695 RepID=UPI0040254970